MRLAGYSLLLLFAVTVPVWSHDPITTRLTWSQEISRIFQKRCITCHRDGGIAPMALTDFTEARPWAKAIKEEVLERRMPPWGAVKGFGEFRNDPSLTQEEILRIAEWVEGGAPAGEEIYLPPEKHFDSKAQAKSPAGIRITGRFRVVRPMVLTAIYPEGAVENAQVIAHLPDGRVVPIVQLRNYKAGWRHSFQLAEPLALSPGSRIEINPPVPVRLVISERRITPNSSRAR